MKIGMATVLACTKTVETSSMVCRSMSCHLQMAGRGNGCGKMASSITVVASGGLRYAGMATGDVPNVGLLDCVAGVLSGAGCYEFQAPHA
jgi:hypothetical protein